MFLLSKVNKVKRLQLLILQGIKTLPRIYTGAEKIAQLVKCLVYKDKDVSSVTNIHIKKPSMMSYL